MAPVTSLSLSFLISTMVVIISFFHRIIVNISYNIECEHLVFKCEHLDIK